MHAVAGEGLDLRFARSLDPDAFADALKGVRYAVVRGARMPATLLDRAPDLVLNHQWGTGVNNIPFAEAVARGIVLARSPGRNVASVADLMIGLMLSVLRRIGASRA